MSSPDILVLNRFLDDYLEIRQATWHSPTMALVNAGSQLKTAGTQVLSKIYDSLPFLSATTSASSQEEVEKIEPQTDEKIITKICTSFKNVFLKAQTIEDWINIIFDLGDQARQSQRRSKSSLLSQTFHAMRTYIIHHLQDEEDFKAYRLELEEKKSVLNKEIFETRLKSLSTTELEAKRNALLYNLADLGDEKYIFKCADYGLFNSLHFPQEQDCHKLSHSRDLAPAPEINIHKPWYYQKNYFLVYHGEHIKTRKVENFDDFTERAKKKGKLIVTAQDTSDSSYSDAAQVKKASDSVTTVGSSPSLQALNTPQTPSMLANADLSAAPAPLNTELALGNSATPTPALGLSPSPLQLPATSASTKKTDDFKEAEPRASSESLQQDLSLTSDKVTVTAASSTLFASGNSKKKNKKGQQQAANPSQISSLHL